MKTAEGWQEVAIRNVSAHGMRISVSVPPRQGAYLEVRHAAQVIVARAVWVDGLECGLRTQDALDIPALVDPKAARAEQVICKAAAETRAPVNPERTAARTRRMVQLFHMAAAAAALLVVAGLAAATVGETLRKPFQKIGDALATPTG